MSILELTLQSQFANDATVMALLLTDQYTSIQAYVALGTLYSFPGLLFILFLTVAYPLWFGGFRVGVLDRLGFGVCGFHLMAIGSCCKGPLWFFLRLGLSI